MSNFFHSWRRTAGCVTSVMALLFTVGWARSCFVQDLIYLPQGYGAARQVLISFDESLTWLSEGCDVVEGPRYFPRWQSKTKVDVKKAEQEHAWITRDIKETRFFGFGRKEEAFAFYYGVRVFVPYSSIAVPLTLLSVYLLFSKPRKAIDQKPTS